MGTAERSEGGGGRLEAEDKEEAGRGQSSRTKSEHKKVSQQSICSRTSLSARADLFEPAPGWWEQ